VTEAQPQRPRPPRWAFIVGGAGLAILLGVIVAVNLQPAPPIRTTTTTTIVTTTTPSTTGPATTSTSTTSTTTTAVPQPPVRDYDVVVVGDGLGGVSAAVAAGRLGANVALLSQYGYLGGQAGSAGVSTMDEGSNHAVLRRSGIYGELATHVLNHYAFDDPGECYFIEDSLCPEPILIDGFLRSLLFEAGVDIHEITHIDGTIQDGSAVTGLIADGSTYNARITIDATEFSDLYPMITGLDYQIGGASACIQDTTWLAIRSWYPGEISGPLAPPRDAADQLFSVYGTLFDEWLTSFRARVVNVPERGATGPGVTPWDVPTETQYRALADMRSFPDEAPAITRTGINYANDHALSTAAIEDEAVRAAEFTIAIDKTYAFLWYLRWELGQTNWGIDNTQGYVLGRRMLQSPQIPDELEVHFPVAPYVREGRRMIGVETLSNADISNDVRGFHRFDNSVMLGGYFSDFHGCTEPESGAGFGLFEVPMGVFIPATVDGFMPGMARSASVSRSAAAAVRTQPEEIWSGQAVGIIAGLAIREGVEVRDVSPSLVQENLLANDLIYFLPDF
jgi:hypothetical protein